MSAAYLLRIVSKVTKKIRQSVRWHSKYDYRLNRHLWIVHMCPPVILYYDLNSLYFHTPTTMHHLVNIENLCNLPNECTENICQSNSCRLD